jgi:hypothetical protein
MCKSKAEGGRRCQGAGTPRGRIRRTQDPSGQAGPCGSPSAHQRLNAEIEAVSQRLDLAATGGGDAQLALEQAAARIRRAYVATSSPAAELDDQASALREAMLGLAGRIDSGLEDELTGRRGLLDSAAAEARSLAGTHA